ncbi:restriction endonuclease subunit S [Streptomyces olivoreticuli]|uniref:restriction endonuclease subunit S n=1 Tax=Streptomyces olivoreticuli TaxID=68246 RepID=UPI00265844F8|nr:restriction endonuclease subunit S [Streptomyces olivoreticuli]WKK25397.1 restriction endonuclease subunit S [Streptomyces olivoreticuli]
MSRANWQNIPLKRIVSSVQSGTSVNGAPWPAQDDELGVLKTSAVYGGVFRPAENKQVDSYDMDRVSCPVLAGSLIVSRMNTKQHLGVAAAVPQDHPNLYLPDRLWAVAFRGADPRFIDWWTKTPAYRTQVEAVCVGTSSSMQNISQGDFLELRIDLPDPETQGAIADYLDREMARIDTLIEEQQRLIEMLRERRRAVCLTAVTRGVDDGVKLIESGDPAIGPMPAHWALRAVRHWLVSLDGSRIPLSAEERGNRQGVFDYYGASGVIDRVDDFLFDEPLVLVSEDGANLLARSTPISFAVKGRYWVNNHAHVLRPIAGDVDFWASRLEALDVSPVVSGSAQPKLTAGALMALRVSAPTDIDEQRRIGAYLGEQTVKIDRLIAETESFIELSQERRAALITAAVTGQIDVREVA